MSNVRLNKIYTRTGDTGQTGLVGGTRVAKHSLRVAAYGEVDETNAAIGLARLHADTPQDECLNRIQHDLFDLGADLATVNVKPEDLRVVASQVERLEREIDVMNEALSPLNSFVLPGGSAVAAHLHLARCVCRRAERVICALAEVEKVNPLVIQYINRLSDHLFVMARAANENGAKDVLWQPGVNR